MSTLFQKSQDGRTPERLYYSLETPFPPSPPVIFMRTSLTSPQNPRNISRPAGLLLLLWLLLLRFLSMSSV